MPDKATYLYYPGHFGPCPVTELTAERGILWDAPGKRVPAEARPLSPSAARRIELVEASRLDGSTLSMCPPSPAGASRSSS